jgi:hypothetical protein
MTLNQLKKAASIYIDREIVAKIDGLAKWVFGIGAGAYLRVSFCTIGGGAVLCHKKKFLSSV